MDNDLNPDALLRYAAANVVGFPPSPSNFTVSKFGHGQSNPTYLMQIGAGAAVKRYVLRKKPAGRFLEGHIFVDPRLPGVEPASRRAIYQATAKALAALHSADVDAIGLGKYGRRESYCKRQDRVIGILDWELSTLGNQMCDVAYCSLVYPYITDFGVDKDQLGKEMEHTGLPEGIPSQAEYVAEYCYSSDIRLTLKKFGSNIIFSYGLKHLYSRGGVLINISDSILAVYTEKGSHCMDMNPTRRTDPEWLVNQRRFEIKIISGWIARY